MRRRRSSLRLLAERAEHGNGALTTQLHKYLALRRECCISRASRGVFPSEPTDLDDIPARPIQTTEKRFASYRRAFSQQKDHTDVDQR
jgi:hypothetical protein